MLNLNIAYLRGFGACRADIQWLISQASIAQLTDLHSTAHQALITLLPITRALEELREHLGDGPDINRQENNAMWADLKNLAAMELARREENP